MLDFQHVDDAVLQLVEETEQLDHLLFEQEVFRAELGPGTVDAPILQTMYLDKPLRDHTLLQAICRTNRPYGQEKTHGLIVDYLGVFDDVAQAIQFDEEGITRVISKSVALNVVPINS